MLNQMENLSKEASDDLENALDEVGNAAGDRHIGWWVLRYKCTEGSDIVMGSDLINIWLVCCWSRLNRFLRYRHQNSQRLTG